MIIRTWHTGDCSNCQYLCSTSQACPGALHVNYTCTTDQCFPKYALNRVIVSIYKIAFRYFL